jgi:type II secretory pathway component PulF
MPEELYFEYRALDARGQTVRGGLDAADLQSGFSLLKLRGLTPIRVHRSKNGKSRAVLRLNDRVLASFAGELAALLKSGADMRTSLSILSEHSDGPQLCGISRQLSADISSGRTVGEAFGDHFAGRFAFFAAVVTAGAATGDLAGALERASMILESRSVSREKLISALAYPGFVLVSALAAFGVLLFWVIPALAPLATSGDAEPSLAMRALLAASDSANKAGYPALMLMGVLLVGLAMLRSFGLLSPMADKIVMNGPFRGFARGVTYGEFSESVGVMITAGAPVTEALRISINTVRSEQARRTLSTVATAVRQGEELSVALRKVQAFPKAISRLAVIGEQTSSLGPMLVRGGRFEIGKSYTRVERVSRMLGPTLIVALGASIGLVMAALLTSISSLGGSALQ